ncbi:PKS_ER domain-containing protein, partial [Haematococcus lacustris]
MPRAVVCRRNGDPTLPIGSPGSVLDVDDTWQLGPLKAEHVRVAVVAASVNFAEGVDLVTAAAVPITYGTADVALRHRANVQKGQTVLVLGAGGGVGVAAVQLAKVQ